MALTRRELSRAAAAAMLAAGGLTAGPALAQAGDEAAIAANIEAFRVAYLAKDMAKLNDLLADTLNYGHSAGRIENKAEFGAALQASKAVLKALNYSDVKVQVNGGSAVARHTWESESELDGKTTQTKIGVMQVWQKQADGKWKLYARQAFRI